MPQQFLLHFKSTQLPERRAVGVTKSMPSHPTTKASSFRRGFYVILKHRSCSQRKFASLLRAGKHPIRFPAELRSALPSEQNLRENWIERQARL